MHTHTHMHTCIPIVSAASSNWRQAAHTCMYIYRHACTYKRMHTYIHIHSHMYIHIHTQAYMRTYSFSCVQ